MSAFVLTIVILYSISILANLYNLHVASKSHKPIGLTVFAIVSNMVFVVWGIALLAR